MQLQSQSATADVTFQLSTLSGYFAAILATASVEESELVIRISSYKSIFSTIHQKTLSDKMLASALTKLSAGRRPVLTQVRGIKGLPQ